MVECFSDFSNKKWPWNAASTQNIPDGPKISIITPSFNQGHYLEETILSVIRQNYSNYELIIVDAGSTDNTIEIIKKYEHWVTYWVSEPDRGQSHAIQKGLTHATGDIINWINSDDLVAPGAFHALAKEFDLDRYDVFCGTCDYFVDDLAHLDKRNERMGVFATVGDTLLACHINQPSTFFKASIFKQLGIDEQFHYTMDVDLWYRYLLMAGHSRIHISDKLLTYFRLHGASKTVADHLKFEGDRNKVYYNVMLSLGQPSALLGFMSIAVSDFELFKPTIYPVGIPVVEVKTFIRTYAWLAVQYYNGKHDYSAVRVCLQVARRYGQPLNLIVLRQLIKHYLIPAALLR